MSERLSLPLAGGSYTAVPVWEEHHRGRNWMAVVAPDGTCPGGLARSFLNRAKGDDLIYIDDPELVTVGAAVEFGADYVTTAGRKRPHRWYGAVLSRSKAAVVVEQAESGLAAWERGQALLASLEAVSTMGPETDIQGVIMGLPAEVCVAIRESGVALAKEAAGDQEEQWPLFLTREVWAVAVAMHIELLTG